MSRKLSLHISRVFNFVNAEKNCVSREFNFAKLTIKIQDTHNYTQKGQDGQFDDCTKDVLEELRCRGRA